MAMFWSRTSHLLCSYHYLSRFSRGSGSRGSVLTSLSPELVVNTTGSESYVPRLAGSLRTPCVCLSAIHGVDCWGAEIVGWITQEKKLLWGDLWRRNVNLNCFCGRTLFALVLHMVWIQNAGKNMEVSFLLLTVEDAKKICWIKICRCYSKEAKLRDNHCINLSISNQDKI